MAKVRPNDDHEDDANDEEGGNGVVVEENTLGINVWDSIQGLERVDISNENLVAGCLSFGTNLELLELKHFMSLRDLI
jgi:hypothetical protein